MKSWLKNTNFCPRSGLEFFHQTYLALHITICKNIINLQGSGLIGESLDLSHISLAVKYRALENKGVSSGLLCKAQTNVTVSARRRRTQSFVHSPVAESNKCSSLKKPANQW